MKKIALLLIPLVFAASCAKEDYLKYDTTQQDGVYLNYTAETDSLFFNFGFDTITEYVVEVEVNLMGMPKDHDRTIAVSTHNERYADSEFIAAKSQYFNVPSTVTLPAGAVSAIIPVTLKRDAELEDTRAIITLQLDSNDDFAVRGQSEYTITFDDKAPATPNWWTTYDMGAFSKLKGQIFFKYFWEMEKTAPAVYAKMVERWGKNLDITPNSSQNSPKTVYRITLNKYVILPMYEYFEAHPELGVSDIQKPTF